MSTSSLYRLSGLALMVGALLAGAGYWLRPEMQGIGHYSLPLYVPSALLGLSGTLLLLIGLPGMYAYQDSRAGRFGLATFALMFLGLAALEVGSAPLYAFVPPLLAASPATWPLLGQPGDGTFEAQMGTAFMAYLATSMISANLGALLYGIATFRARVFPRWAAVMVVTGVPAAFLLGGVLGHKPMVVMYLGFAWWGYAMMRGANATTRPAPVGGPAAVQQAG